MRLGLFLSSLGGGPEAYARMVRAAEETGLDSAWVPDHVLKIFGPVLDPLTALAFLAGFTSRIELGTSVLVLPYHHPVPLANATSTLDVLSGGRFVLGAGAGWNAGEFEALGMSVRERGRRTDEILECLRRLWSGERSSFSGRYYSFHDAEIGTRPRTPGGPPVLIGGKSEAALRRTLRFSRGWMGFRDGPDAIREVRERLDLLGEEYGTDPGVLKIGTTLDVRVADSGKSGDSPEAVVERLGLLEEAGASFCALSLSPATTEALAWVVEEVAPRAS